MFICDSLKSQAEVSEMTSFSCALVHIANRRLLCLNLNAVAESVVKLGCKQAFECMLGPSGKVGNLSLIGLCSMVLKPGYTSFLRSAPHLKGERSRFRYN